MIENAPALTVPVQIANNKVTVGPNTDEADIIFVRLLERHETNVKGGENKGRKLSGENIVLEAVLLGQAGSSPTEFSLPEVGEGETCAVLVQTLDGDPGPMLGAAKCS